MTQQAAAPAGRTFAPGALEGVRVLDLSRVLAGPWATQILGDLGADVVKVEKPGEGDGTREWGPPFLKDAAGRNTAESAYYLSTNRNKRSVAIDFTRPEGQALIRRLAARSDVLIENFKVGTLARFGLGYEDLRKVNPRLVYCSITGFGQDGPYAARAGYDYLAQGMGGIMSLTGPADGEPAKVGVAIADVMTGMYATVAILAMLRRRDATGEGQHADVSLLECQIAWLANQAQSYLTSGEAPPRLGNAHPSIAPYETFPTRDGTLILAVGNDRQFRTFCEAAGAPALADDPRFRTNEDRVHHRTALAAEVRALTARRTTREWIELLEDLKVPAGPVNTIPQVFEDPHVRARGAVVEVEHPLAPRPIRLLASPLRLGATPPTYRRAPPTLGQHTDDVLGELLALSPADLAALRGAGAIG
jgi:crotonobetainyl-CoA:carnitine CoA-transferase CaiB-like acyl-CoA transferase